MGFQKVNHSVVMPFSAQALDAVGGTAPTVTSEWFDVNGWTEKKLSWEVDSSGAVDIDIILQHSPQGYYELNNKTVTTDDYIAINAVTTHTAAILAQLDSDDLDDLQRAMRSVRFIIDNDSATACTASVWFEGWS